MHASTTTPDTKVNAATTQIADAYPYRSARTPDSAAPTAYPPSRQRRYTPTAVARQSGAEASDTAASRVGYTHAVPMPRSTAAAIHSPNVPPTTNSAIPTAWIHIPATIIPLRPQTSLNGPVAS